MLALLAGATVSGALNAQELFSTGNGEGTVGNDRMSWTIGEPISETVTDGTQVLTQGFEQPWAVVTTEVGGAIEAGAGIHVFPNPVRSTLHVVLDHPEQAAGLELMDAEGRLVRTERVQGSTMELDMTTYRTGTYYLRLHDAGGGPKETFKINVIR